MGLAIISVTYSVSWAVLGVEKRRRKQQHYTYSSNEIGVRRQYADSQLYRTILSRIIATRIVLSGDLKDDGDEFVNYSKETNTPIDVITEALYAFMMAKDDDTVESICRSTGYHHVIPSLSIDLPKSLTFLPRWRVMLWKLMLADSYVKTILTAPYHITQFIYFSLRVEYFNVWEN